MKLDVHENLITELKKNGLSNKKIAETLNNLYPDLGASVSDLKSFTRKQNGTTDVVAKNGQFQETKYEEKTKIAPFVKSYVGKKIIIFSAQGYGAVGEISKVNKDVLASIKNYIREEEIDEVLCLPMFGQWIHDNKVLPDIEEFLSEVGGEVINKSRRFNDSICVSNFNVYPQVKYPLRTLDKVAFRESSTVMSGTKIHYRALDTRSKYPRFVATTGAVTLPNYRDTAVGRVAKEEHQYGFTRLDIISNKFYTHRQVPMCKNGKFVDIDKEYTPTSKKSKKVQAEALILGDVHVDNLNPDAWKMSLEHWKVCNPKKVFLHDLLEGRSINHHRATDLIEREKMKTSGLTLKKEIQGVYDLLKDLEKTFPKTDINVVYSNHDDWLNRYVRNVANIKHDDGNRLMWVELFKEIFNNSGIPALELAIKIVTGKTLKSRFLKKNELVRVKGIDCSAHGDQGVNGGRANVTYWAKRNAVVAHTHTPQLIGDCMIVGTNSNVSTGWQRDNNGSCSWMHGNGIINKYGLKQLLTFIVI